MKLVEIQLVAVFKPSVALGLFLDGVVREVDELVFTVVEFVLLAAGSEIPFFAKVYFKILIDQDPNTNVEFPLVDQIGPFYVLLYYEGLIPLDDEWVLRIGIFCALIQINDVIVQYLLELC